jgi:hypothetical protein
MTDVLQCPHCELRFTTRSELEQHKSFDHPRAQEVAPRAEPAPPLVEKQEPKEQAAGPPQRRGLLSRVFNVKRRS